MSKNSQLAQLLHFTALIIWDEMPMQHYYCFKAVHHIFTNIHFNTQALFGGVPIILGNDFV